MTYRRTLESLALLCALAWAYVLILLITVKNLH